MSKIIRSEWQCNKVYINKWSLFAESILISLKKIKIKMKINSSSRVSIQDHSVGLILIFVELKKILAHVKLVYLRKYIKGMMKHKIKIHLKRL